MAHLDRDPELPQQRRVRWDSGRHLRPACVHDRGLTLFTVIGSGFGLYGYLPAIVETFDEAVILPETYRPRIATRPELAKYVPRIRWASTQAKALETATAAVIALPPILQREMALHCCGLANLQTLFLEKPIAANPIDAARVIDEIRRSRKRVRVGYTFLHTDWSATLDLPRLAVPHDTVTITWRFMAHHFANALDNWKARHSEGGGALRFFAIHLLAVLASQGYSTANRSVLSGTITDCPERWDAAFTGAGLPQADVEVDTRSGTNVFCFRAGGGAVATDLVNLRDPFPSTSLGIAEDRRVPILKRLLGTIDAADEALSTLYDHINELWLKTESVTEFADAGTAPAAP